MFAKQVLQSDPEDYLDTYYYCNNESGIDVMRAKYSGRWVRFSGKWASDKHIRRW